MFSAIYIVLNPFLQRHVSANTIVNMHDVLRIWWYPVARYWFLWVLLIYFLISAIFANKHKNMIVIAFLAIGLALLCEGGQLSGYLKWGLVYYMYFIWAVVLGNYNWRERVSEIVYNNYSIIISAICTILFIVGLYYKISLQISAERCDLFATNGMTNSDDRYILFG